MAEERLTPEDLAEAMQDLVGSVQPGRAISLEDIDRVANAANLTEALRLATQLGVASAGVPIWEEAQRQVQTEMMEARSSAMLEDLPRLEADENYPVVAGSPRRDSAFNQPDQLTQTLGNVMVTEDIDGETQTMTYLERLALREQERLATLGEDSTIDIKIPNLLFPGDLQLSDPDVLSHMEVVTSDDYSPWTAGGRFVSRRDMSHFIEINQPLPGGSGDLNFQVEAQEASYWNEQFSTPGLYASGDELLVYASLPATTRARLEQKFVDAGLLQVEDDVLGYQPGAMGFEQLNAMRQAMSWGTYFGKGFELALNDMVAYKRRADAINAARARGPSGPRRASFSVPASLREIPDYESISQEVTNMFRQRLGRDLEDYEVAALADEMQSQYRNSNAERIKAARAAFYAAQGGGQGIMEVEVPNPQLRTQRFLEERYGNEIGRYEQMEDTAVTNRLLIDGITKGASMVGGG